MNRIGESGGNRNQHVPSPPGYASRYASITGATLRSRRLFAVVALLCGVAFFVAAWRTASSPAILVLPRSPYTSPSVPQEFSGPIKYLSKSHDRRFDADDGPVTYLHNHRAGWDICLLYFYNDWCDFTDSDRWLESKDEDGQAPWLIGAPPHINTARRHGWLACTQEIDQLCSLSSPDALRTALPVRNNAFNLACVGCAAIVASLSLARLRSKEA